jgi:hypothetical protein
MKFIIGVVILFSLLFLFGGLVAVGTESDDQSNNVEVKKAVSGYVSQPVTEEYSIKQIDSLSSRYNYAFTSSNANGSSVYP